MVAEEMSGIERGFLKLNNDRTFSLEVRLYESEQIHWSKVYLEYSGRPDILGPGGHLILTPDNLVHISGCAASDTSGTIILVRRLLEPVLGYEPKVEIDESRTERKYYKNPACRYLEIISQGRWTSQS